LTTVDEVSFHEHQQELPIQEVPESTSSTFAKGDNQGVVRGVDNQSVKKEDDKKRNKKKKNIISWAKHIGGSKKKKKNNENKTIENTVDAGSNISSSQEHTTSFDMDTIQGSHITQLVNMGFEPAVAIEALNRYDQDLEKATNFLLDQN
jgi:hypothetical protein